MTNTNFNYLSAALAATVFMFASVAVDACDKQMVRAVVDSDRMIEKVQPASLETRTDAKAAVEKRSAIKRSGLVRSVGKASAPMQFVKPVRYKLDNGESATLTLQVRISEDLDQLTVEPNADPGLVLMGAPGPQELGPQSAGSLVDLKFDVIATAEGLHYINAILSSKSARGNRMTSYSLPAEVGDIRRAAAAKPQADIRLDSTGRKVRVMRALESTPEKDTHIQ